MTAWISYSSKTSRNFLLSFVGKKIFLADYGGWAELVSESRNFGFETYDIWY